MNKKLESIKGNTANRIIFNTIIIYVQRFSAALLALVTTPLLLRTLGVEDYGVYNLTIGFVGMLSFFTWSLSSTTQRYISVTLGAKDYEKLSRIMSTSFYIHLLYGLLILGIILSVSFLFANEVVNIPTRRATNIKYILSFVAGISFFNIISIPFLGALRASEDFISIAIIGITESILKLSMAFTLLFVGGDKLIIFSGLMFGVSIVIFSSYFLKVFLSKDNLFNKFVRPDFSLIKEMLAFISWTLLGALAIMSRNQGVQVVLNIFFGVVTNAAYGISVQINNALNILSQGFTGSMGPILMKSAGEGNYERMMYMMRTMAKLSFFSISIFSIPLLFEMPVVLELWLKNIPDGSIVFSRLTVILILTIILSSGMQNAFMAIGKVKSYNLYVSALLILNLPIAYLIFKSGFPDYSIIIVGIILEVISLIIRLVLLKKYLGYRIITYVKEIGQILIPSIAVVILLFLFNYYYEAGSILHVLLSFLISLIISPIIIYKFSMDTYQKQFISSKLSKIKFNK